MLSLIYLTVALFRPSSSLPSSTPAYDPLSFVDPLIGSKDGGNVFAGATLPYGMAKAVADVSGQNTGGFSTDGSKVTGFSHMHDSGTGGNPSLGNFPLFPQLCGGDDINNCLFPKARRATDYRNDSVVATPGYFAIELDNGIRAEMTVTEHTALYRFHFPKPHTQSPSVIHPMLMIDLTDLWDSRQNASIDIDPDAGRMVGNATFLPSFGGGYYMLHFCVDFADAEVYDSGIWVDDRAGAEPQQIFVTRGVNLFYLQAGGFVRFDPPEHGVITARVGLSFISTDKACKNAEKEIPDPQHAFGRLRERAENAWREKLELISIQPGNTSDDLQRMFWSGIYRNMISPQDYTGENPLWQSSEPYFDSFYCIWDSFRAQHPLLTIVDPITQSMMVRSLLDTYKHEGWLPDCRMSLCKGWTQGGSNADVIMADAYVKNLTGIDWDLAYEAVVNDAENEPLEWSKEGRGGLMSWKKLGYIPYLDYDYLGFGTNSRSISRTLEYSYNDFCVAILAKGLGKEEEYTKYLGRSANWRNLFKEDQISFISATNSVFTGFFQPKYLNGTWGYQNPVACSPFGGWCSLTSNPAETFESSIWEYQFFAPHDTAALIKLLGGSESFISRLSYFHSSPLSDISNEPVFLTTYLYHYAGRPGLSSLQVWRYIPAQFNATYAGLPGNDDGGAMGAFAVFGMIGMFPVAGQNMYLITAPFFPEIRIKNQLTGRVATIRIVRGSGVYIQSAKVNGKAYARSWIEHEFWTEGWTLELVLGEVESEWGTREEDLPYSVSTGRTSVVDR